MQGRGAFYDQTGAIRDVIQNHIFQVMCNLAMECPAQQDSESMRDEKVKVLKAIPAIEAKNLVRGQFVGISMRRALRRIRRWRHLRRLQLEIKSWRWDGVPFYIRAGKNLPVTCTEVMARLRRPPATNMTDTDAPQNYHALSHQPGDDDRDSGVGCPAERSG